MRQVTLGLSPKFCFQSSDYVFFSTTFTTRPGLESTHHSCLQMVTVYFVQLHISTREIPFLRFTIASLEQEIERNRNKKEAEHEQSPSV